MEAATPLRGLIAATYTPLRNDGSLHLAHVGPLYTLLRDRQRVDGLYVCGSTGEGVSLTSHERQQVAEAFVEAAGGEMPVVVQVGHNSLAESRALAAHAASIGASAISANAPSYFKVTDVDTLVRCMQFVASGAADLPFYYYHIPHLTGAQVDMLDFLQLGSQEIPNLVGIKFTSPMLHEYRACLGYAEGQFDILWGSDEMLLSALAMGATGAVGSTYNVAGPSYQKLIECFRAGDIAGAQAHQDRCNLMIRTVYQYPFHAAMKAILRVMGVECGQCRLPQRPLSTTDEVRLQRDLERIGFYAWDTL